MSAATSAARAARADRPARPKRASALPWSRPAPVRLAPDENLLWADAPTFWPMAQRLYHVRAIAVYGAALMLADVVQAKLHGLTLWPALEAAIPGMLTALVGLGIFCALAWASARTTRYTLTTKRLVMQFGLALPKTLGIPLPQIAAVAVRMRGDGTGDLTLKPHAGAKLGYLKLWPFARPWRFGAPEPMLREVPAAGYVGTVLSRMVAEAQPRPAADDEVRAAAA